VFYGTSSTVRVMVDCSRLKSYTEGVALHLVEKEEGNGEQQRKLAFK